MSISYINFRVGSKALTAFAVFWFGGRGMVKGNVVGSCVCVGMFGKVMEVGGIWGGCECPYGSQVRTGKGYAGWLAGWLAGWWLVGRQVGR